MSLVEQLGPHLPYLRRYARALTGSQKSGDAYVKAALQALAAGEAELEQLPPRVALYKLFQVIWGQTGAKLESAPEQGDRIAQRVMRIPPRHRQAFLLTALESFTIDEAAQILDDNADGVRGSHVYVPWWLYDKKNPGRSNWLHPLARPRWNAYVDKMVRAMAPYATYFAPQNEPNGQIITAYIVGVWPPGMDLAFGHYKKAIIASTDMFRDAAARIKAIKPTAKVMSVEALPWWERAPLDPGGVIYNTMIHGNIDHLDRIYDVCDIIGFNYYYSQAPGPLSLLAEPYRRGHNFTMMGWYIDPNGLYKEIKRVGNRYGKPMMITENGIATPDDKKRVWYVRNHIAAIGRAIRDVYDVRGYFAWSLADNYEWHYGYKALFGLAQMALQGHGLAFGWRIFSRSFRRRRGPAARRVFGGHEG
jgi:beta-glucosidase